MKLKHINTILLILIIVINGYVILAPFIPGIVFSHQNHSAQIKQLERVIHSRAAPHKGVAVVSHANSVIVPAMLLNTPILEGPVSQQYQILNNGVWRWPKGSTPDKGGNTVLIGHRFTYTNPRGIFYFLNKINLGDTIGIWWNNKEYVYSVASIQEVSPNDTAIENPSTQPELTLFTCTPLWLPKDRLVVVANLETHS